MQLAIVFVILSALVALAMWIGSLESRELEAEAQQDMYKTLF